MGQEISKEENARKLAAEELLKKIKSNQPEELTSDNDFNSGSLKTTEYKKSPSLSKINKFIQGK